LVKKWGAMILALVVQARNLSNVMVN